MRKILLFVALMMSGCFAWGQAPNIQWQKSLGGSKDDFATCIHQTTDGGYIVAGYTSSNDGNIIGNHGGADYWVVKLDGTGNIQWDKILGGTMDDEALSVVQTVDGGYIVAGSSYSIDGDVVGHHGDTLHSDYWIVKLNANGIIQWQKSLGGTANDIAHSIQQTNDGQYIVAGESYSTDNDVSGHHGSDFYADYWIVKLNSTGTIQWQKSMGGTKTDVANSIQQTKDEGFIIAGQSWSNDDDVIGNHGSYDYWILKINAGGVIQWQKSLGGTDVDEAFVIKQTIDNGYIVAGTTYSINGDVIGNHGFYDSWVVKLDENGFTQWQKPLGGTLSDGANSIIQTKDGGYTMIGYARSNDCDVQGNHGVGYDYWVVNIDSNGIIQWQKTLGGSNYEAAYSFEKTIDEGYVIAGNSYSKEGDITNHHGSTNFSDYWIVKLAGTTGIEDMPNTSISISPNPTTGQFSIIGITKPTVAIYNLMGQKLVALKGNNEVNLVNLPTGIYLVQIFDTNMELVKSIQMMKQ